MKTDPTSMVHLDTAEIDARVAHAGPGTQTVGTVDLIVRRPTTDEREVLDVAELVVGRGLLGDNYIERGCASTPDRQAHPEAQLNVMNSCFIDVLANHERARWALAGDQFFVDLDLSVEHLPAGSRLRIGTAVIEVAGKPHTGCSKFADRFGIDAARWVNQHKQQRRRGLCAIVVEPGTVVTGDEIRVLG